VARIEAISILLAFASLKELKLFQMDVKSTFLNGYIQPPSFVHFEKPNHVYELKKYYIV